MRRKTLLACSILLAAVAGVAAIGAWVSHRNAAAVVKPNSMHVALIGASIGRGWRLAEFPSRAGLPGITAEAVAAWQFDKSEAVDDLLLRPRRRFELSRSYLRSLWQAPPAVPDVVVLKECSAYFPAAWPARQNEYERWVRRLRERGVRVILATVVPVTLERAARDGGKQPALLAFNRWVREYARREVLDLLDLEAALSEGPPDFHLKREYAQTDGSHLNEIAYRLLDNRLRDVLAAPRHTP